MTSILNNSLRVTFALAALLFIAAPFSVLGQTAQSQTISVSPTLFEMKAAQGQVWQSELRVVNVNDYSLTVYPQVVDFLPLGETGRVDLLFGSADDADGATLASWVDITSAPVTIPAQQTVTIPFSVNAPADAPPGGHYAAILIGTRPPTSDQNGSLVQTAQFVTSLLFVRVDGNIIESGTIREFTTNKLIVPNPEISFELRFENNGNVYLQPQGEITIFNMWGTKRGVIPVNHQTHYGRVIQNSIREFIFSWKGEATFLDIGRYKAVATLGYGENAKQFTTSTTYFWIIPYQQIIIALLVIFSILFFISWVIKLYIRRMFMLAGIDPEMAKHRMRQRSHTLELSSRETKNPTTILAPLRQGIVDMRSKFMSPGENTTYLSTIVDVVIAYRKFFIAVIGMVIICSCIYWFIGMVRSTDKQFEVTIEHPDASVTLSSEEMYYQSLVAEGKIASSTMIFDQPFEIDIINRSGTLGVAAKIRVGLEEKGYQVRSLTSEIGESTNRTVIVFHPEVQEHALALSKTLSGALLSASTDQDPATITIYAGSDFLR